MSSEEVELRDIERQLKDWFLTRRVLLERTTALKRLFTKHNVTGLTGAAPPTASASERTMWSDLTKGRPEVEEQLSINARDMKADMYLDMFKTATSLEHPCREPGVSYLLCLKERTQVDAAKRKSDCDATFDAFSACRSSLLRAQSTALRSSLVKQQQYDNYAADLWNRRAELLQRTTAA